jgi:ADP-ribosylglycohydrolase
MKKLKSLKAWLFAPLLILCPLLLSCGREKKAVINKDEFRDKVYACWLGKNIGGTLGMPFEGDTSIHSITFYTKAMSDEPEANDDLDLQILWLKAMQEHNAHVDAFILGKYWLRYVPVNWNEYGVGKANMHAGFMPPVSGEFSNSKWKTSNGAWIRSEIWACLFPGDPLMAARFAREDACVDHGMAEGTYAEIFTASIESAAFVEHDRDSLINFGLSMVPSECRISKAVRTALDAKARGLDWKEARNAVVRSTEDMGWFQAPRNVAFTMIGWLYGEGDFGKSICIAINCGDDTDCTGATLGSIFGIIGGTKAIPEEWRKPIGNRIVNVAINGFAAPATLDVLTDSTVSITRKTIKRFNLPVSIGQGITDVSGLRGHLRPDPKELRGLWDLSPWKVVRHNTDWVIQFDYLREPVIAKDTARNIQVSISNVSGRDETYSLRINGIPDSVNIAGLPGDTVCIPKEGKRVLDISFLARTIAPDTMRMHFVLARGTDSDTIPFTFLR